MAILGPLQVTVDDVEIEFTAEKEKTLLAALAAGGESGVPLVRLIDELWTAPTASSKGTLQTYVSNVRKAVRSVLGGAAPIIERVGESYRLSPQVVDTDIAFFRRKLAGAREASTRDDDDPLVLIEEALRQVRGALDPSVVQATGFLAGESVRVHDEYLEAKWLWAELAIDSGRAASVVTELRSIVENDPTEERFWRLLMLAYWRTGRQQAALDAYQQVRAVLADELGVLPDPSLQDLEQAILRHDPTLGKPDHAGAARQSTGNLPRTRNSFVGRVDELANVQGLLSNRSLITLRGAGGCGKSRLAREVAAAVQDDFAGGAWLIDLGEVESASNAPIIDMIATAVGMIRRSQGSLDGALIDHLQRAPTLLVLDNCEHVIDAVADSVARLVDACHELTVLATTRESLRLAGETIVPVRPLRVAEAGEAVVADSARLFLDRSGLDLARSAARGETLELVHEICRRLDGVPLAIELAAALVETTPMTEILEELHADQFGLLSVGMRGASEHHRNLQAVVDWSYDRLEAHEQALFIRLAIFPGSFTSAAASAVGGPASGSIKRSLDGLVRKSLIETVTSEQGVERYRILEMLRDYGLTRLNEAELTTEVETRFISYFSVLDTHEAHESETGVVDWIERLRPDIANLRLAIRRAMDTNAIDAALRLIDSFRWYYNYVGSLEQTEAWLLSLAPRAAMPVDGDGLDFDPVRDGGALTLSQQVLVFTSLASLANLRSSYSETGHWSDLAVLAAREHGDVHQRAAALVVRGATAVFENRIDVALAAFNESLDLTIEIGDRWARAVTLMFMAVGERRAAAQQARADPTSAWMARLDEIRRRFERAFELFSQMQDDRGMAMVLINLGRIEEHKGDLHEASILCDQGLVLAENNGDSIVSSLAYLFRGRMAAGMDDSEYAVECFTKALQYSESIERSRVLFSSAAEWLGIVAARLGDVEPLLRIAAATEVYRMAPPTTAALPHLHDERARVREALGNRLADELEEEGRLMSPDAVKALALRAGAAAVAVAR